MNRLHNNTLSSSSVRPWRGQFSTAVPVLLWEAVESEMLEILVGRDGEQHLAAGEPAKASALAMGGDQMVTLPRLNKLGTIIKTAEQGNGKIRQEGPSTCVNSMNNPSSG